MSNEAIREFHQVSFIEVYASAVDDSWLALCGGLFYVSMYRVAMFMAWQVLLNAHTCDCFLPELSEISISGTEHMTVFSELVIKVQYAQTKMEYQAIKRMLDAIVLMPGIKSG